MKPQKQMKGLRTAANAGRIETRSQAKYGVGDVESVLLMTIQTLRESPKIRIMCKLGATFNK
jgi:hypothetical protein